MQPFGLFIALFAIIAIHPITVEGNIMLNSYQCTILIQVYRFCSSISILCLCYTFKPVANVDATHQKSKDKLKTCS